MPRISAESRSAAAFRAGGSPPEPPRHLAKAAAAVWREIAASKPPDWFDQGSWPLLARYCTLEVQARRLEKRLETLMKAGAWKDASGIEKRLLNCTQGQTTLATKLRLSIQAVVDRHSRKLAERGQGKPDAKPDTLLGGQAVWGDSAKVN